jgi:hypothetical protein
MILAAVPAAAQVSQLSSQTLFYHQAGNTFGGNYLTADGGVIYSDNVEGHAGGAADTMLLLGLSGDTSHEGTRFDYHLDSNIALVKYLSGSFPTRPTGFLDGLAALRIVPGFFSWIARETYSQVQFNIYAPVTPENLVSLNYLTTGPRFTLRPTLRTSVRLDAVYSYLSTSSVSSQFVDFDNHRYGGTLIIDRAFSDTASLYLKGDYQKVEFKDQEDNNNFSIGTASGGYKLTNGRTVFDISGGYSQLRIYDVLSSGEGIGGERETRKTEEFDEPVWKLQLSRLITPTQRLGLIASQQFIDVAAAFRLGFDGPAPITAPPQVATSEPFRQRQFGVDWEIEGARTSLVISLHKTQQRYALTTGNDLDMKIANALLARQLSPTLTWDIGASYQRTDQVGTPAPGLAPASAKVIGALTDLRWQVGEHLNLRFIYSYTSWSSVYSSSQIGVIASWALIPSRATQEGPPSLSPISPASTLAH